jgi:hypothetical protein
MENSQLIYGGGMYIRFENKNSFLKIKCIKSNVKNKFGPKDNTGGVGVIRYFWSHFYRPKNKRKNQIKIQKKQKTLNDINSKFGEFMSSFHFLPTKKLTWEIHATLWDGAGRSHTYGGECSLRVSQHSSDIVWSYLDSHFRSFSHWVNFISCRV